MTEKEKKELIAKKVKELLKDWSNKAHKSMNGTDDNITSEAYNVIWAVLYKVYDDDDEIKNLVECMFMDI